MESLDQFRHSELRLKARNVFVMSLRLSDHKILHRQHRIFIKFFRFPSDFLAFFARISYFLEFKEFNKTIIPFALVGYETGYNQLAFTRLVGYLPSHIQRALMEQLLNNRELGLVCSLWCAVCKYQTPHTVSWRVLQFSEKKTANTGSIPILFTNSVCVCVCALTSRSVD